MSRPVIWIANAVGHKARPITFLTTAPTERIVLVYLATHLTRVFRRKPILSEQALLFFGAVRTFVA